MAVSTDTQIASFASTGNVTTTGARAVGSAVAAGSLVTVELSAGAQLTSASFTVTDSKSNTYTLVDLISTATAAQTVALYASVITVALTTSDTITATRTPTGGFAMTARAWTGADATTPFGTPVKAAASSAGSPSAASLTVPTDGMGLMLFSHATNATVGSLGSGWTSAGAQIPSGSGNPRGLQVARASATATPSATMSTGVGWALVAVAINPASVDPPDPPDVSAARVAIIGDSLTERAEDHAAPPTREALTRARFVSAGFTDSNLYWYGKGGKSLVASDSGGKTTVQNIDDAVTALGGPADVWVIALGTNNSGDSDSTFNANMATVLNKIASVGGGIILWVNLGYWSPSNTNAVRLNPLINTAVTGAGGSVLDFNSFMGNPRIAGDWIYPTDSTHLTPQGYEKRDWFIIDGTLSAIEASARSPYLVEWDGLSATPLRLIEWNGLVAVELSLLEHA